MALAGFPGEYAGAGECGDDAHSDLQSVHSVAPKCCSCVIRSPIYTTGTRNHKRQLQSRGGFFAFGGANGDPTLFIA